MLSLRKMILCASLGLAPVIASVVHPPMAAAFPKPSIYPISWQIKFEHSKPKRIVVTTPGTNVPLAYWYMTYSVTNDTDQEQSFLPVFEMITNDGKVLRSDKDIPTEVFSAIKKRERSLPALSVRAKYF